MRHRRIDAYTDRHPEVKKTHNLFKPPLRRFAGIITDVVFDHYLARDWSLYSDTSLEEHVESVHDALNQHRSQLPPALQRFITFIQMEQVLLGNQTYQGVEITLQRLSRRSERFAAMAGGAAVAAMHEEALSACFHGFFPELLAVELAR